MLKKKTHLTWLAAAFLPGVALAGGVLSMDEPAGSFYRWNSGSPIVLNMDLGNLGILSKAEADALALDAVRHWSKDNISTCNLSFQKGPDLSEDHGDGTGSDAAYFNSLNDGLSPVIYDQNGSITASVFAGGETVIAGFAGPDTITITNEILEGRAVFNGLFYDGISSSTNPPDLTLKGFKGVMVHEFGHMLNLDHSVFNDSFAHGLARAPVTDLDFTDYPTMHPYIHNDSDSLALDDEAWISFLYPSGEFAQRTAFSGTVTGPSGLYFEGANIVLRSATDLKLAVSCVSGYDNASELVTTGAFLFPGLLPESRWVIEVEPLPSYFTAFSSVGTLDPPAFLPGPPEFLNERTFESASDPVNISTTWEAGAAGTQVAGMLLQLNEPQDPVIISEVDPPGAAAFPLDAMTVSIQAGVPTQINGTITAAEGGSINLGGDVYEDWYKITSPGPVELNRILLTPSSESDLNFVLAYHTEGTPKLYSYSLNAGAGVAELVEVSLDTYSLGDVYVGISAVPGTNDGSYTLRLEASPSARASVVISDIENPMAGVLVIRGRGFSSEGGAPTVTFSNYDVTVLSEQFISENELRVEYSTSERVPPPVTIQVTNTAAMGSNGGRFVYQGTLDYSAAYPPGFEAARDAMLGILPATEGADRNGDTIIDAGDLDL